MTDWKLTGQPYAFKQAGMVTGIILLVALTVVVCSLTKYFFNLIEAGSRYLTYKGGLDHTVCLSNLSALNTVPNLPPPVLLLLEVGLTIFQLDSNQFQIERCKFFSGVRS